MKPDVLIEAVLFYNTGPMAKKELGSFLAIAPDTLDSALAALRERLLYGATRIIDTGDTVQLVTAPEMAETLEKLRKQDLAREIGKAGAETLAIILYRGPISRAQIDFIRGVNSAFILRNLQIRGLIERKENPTTVARSFQYIPTAELYAYLGITDREALPQYVSIMNEIDRFEKESGRDPEHMAESAPAVTTLSEHTEDEDTYGND